MLIVGVLTWISSVRGFCSFHYSDVTTVEKEDHSLNSWESQKLYIYIYIERWHPTLCLWVWKMRIHLLSTILRSSCEALNRHHRNKPETKWIRPYSVGMISQVRSGTLSVLSDDSFMSAFEEFVSFTWSTWTGHTLEMSRFGAWDLFFFYSNVENYAPWKRAEFVIEIEKSWGTFIIPMYVSVISSWQLYNK